MKFGNALIGVTLLSTGSLAAVADIDAQPQSLNTERLARSTEDLHDLESRDLFKRKGGGGRGGRGGTSSGSGSSSGGSGSSAPRGGANGGRTVGGSGPQPRFAGGRVYPGGAAAPYRAGSRSPVAGIAAFALVGAAAWAFWPGTWYGSRIHAYRYDNTYSFYNATADQNQTKPILCACADEAPCACDEPEDRSERDEWLDEIIGNGSYPALNKSIVDVADYEGRSTILLNGTLPDDTTLADANADDDSAAESMRVLLENLGWWPTAAVAMAAVLVA